METLSGLVFKTGVKAGPGFDIQKQVLNRLGDETREQFYSLSTSGQIRQFAEEHQAVLQPEELTEFYYYANLIGILFGFQDEKTPELS